MNTPKILKKGQNSLFYRHEYLRDTLSQRYKECESCKIRTQFTCVVCGFCWSCHWKLDQLSKIPEHLLKDSINFKKIIK